jgi:hypothetical protein
MAAKAGTGITELRKAVDRHRKDADVLRGGHRWQGAMYHGGYVIECLLKSRLMIVFGCRHLEELQRHLRGRGRISDETSLFTHQLELLLDLLPASTRLKGDAGLLKAFNGVNRWKPAWRYVGETADGEDARAYLTDVDLVRKWIEGNR